MSVEETSKSAVFEGKRIRKTLHEGEWWFSIIDVVEVLVIPSPKVEPLKRWLARVGRERIDEIENPELAMARMQKLYWMIGSRLHDSATDAHC